MNIYCCTDWRFCWEVNNDAPFQPTRLGIGKRKVIFKSLYVSSSVCFVPNFPGSFPDLNQFLKLIVQKLTGLDPVGRHFGGHLGGIFGKPSVRKDTCSLWKQKSKVQLGWFCLSLYSEGAGVFYTVAKQLLHRKYQQMTICCSNVSRSGAENPSFFKHFHS